MIKFLKKSKVDNRRILKMPKFKSIALVMIFFILGLSVPLIIVADADDETSWYYNSVQGRYEASGNGYYLDSEFMVFPVNSVDYGDRVYFSHEAEIISGTPLPYLRIAFDPSMVEFDGHRYHPNNYHSYPPNYQVSWISPNHVVYNFVYNQDSAEEKFPTGSMFDIMVYFESNKSSSQYYTWDEGTNFGYQAESGHDNVATTHRHIDVGVSGGMIVR